MRVYESLDAIAEAEFADGTVIAIGKFDGVHLGHRALLRRMGEVSAAEDLQPLVFTFANNPLSYLRPDLCPPELMSKQQRLDTLEREGVAACVMLEFDAQLAQIPATEFVEELLIGRLGLKHLCVGEDFRFGSGGLGDVKLLSQLGSRFGFSVDVIGNVDDAAIGRVSSSRVREAMLQGDVATAARLLDRPARIRATVVHGDARGRELGFPTANLGGIIEGLRPADGVYAGYATVGGERFKAAISVGANVTFDPEGEPRVEAYLIDFDEDLYGKTIELEFVERLRGMTAFASVDALIARMHEDVRETRVLLVR